MDQGKVERAIDQFWKLTSPVLTVYVDLLGIQPWEMDVNELYNILR